jgi:cobalt/nickel transport protein
MVMKKFNSVVVGLLIALVIGVFLSPFASSFPDGLERVAEDKGFIERAVESGLPYLIPDYAFPGVENEKLATSLAGFIGVIITFGAAMVIGKVVARKECR